MHPINHLELAIWQFGLDEKTNGMVDVHKKLQEVLNLLQKYKEEGSG